MLIERKNMEIEPRPNMRGGPGVCAVTFLAGRKLDQKHAKLFSEITIPPGAGIGEHEHSGETEYYLILEGTGQVNDNGTIVQVKPGDVVVTTGGAKHSIHTTGDITLRMVAVIITDE